LKDGILSNIKLLKEIYGDWRVSLPLLLSAIGMALYSYCLLHCSIARDLSSFSFSLIGGQWGISFEGY
jgi:hypothetical protein